jgi:aromatic-L-amino-acid decarboxylase
MDQQVVGWCKDMIGFLASASGTLVSGGSVVNLIGIEIGNSESI